MLLKTSAISFIKKIAVKIKSKSINEFINSLVVLELGFKFNKVVKRYDTQSLDCNFENSKLIWFCWFQGIENAPELVKACYKSVLENKPDGFVINLITDDNYSDFVEFPVYILEKVQDGKISRTHFSDILRFTLLAEYGGIWVDSSILILKKMDSTIVKSNFFTLKSAVFEPFTSISNGRWTGYFIAFPKNMPEAMFVRDCFFEYWKNENHLFDYYFIDYLLLLTYKKISSFKNKVDALELYGNNRMLLKNILNTPINKDDDQKLKMNKVGIYKLNNKMEKKMLDDAGNPTYYSKVISNGFE